MDARLKAYMKVSLKILLWAAVFLSVLLVVYKLFFYILPFAIAFIIASSIEPAIRYLINKARMKRKLAAPLVLLAFFGIFGTILTILAIRLISEIADLTQQLPQYYNKIYGSLKMIIDRAAELYVELPKEITGQVEQVMSNFSKSLVDMINAFFKAILNTAVSIPDALIFLIVTILATYFLVVDRETIYRFVRAQIPDEVFYRVRSIKNDLFSALFGYIRAQLILMTVTFFELFAGFSLIGVKHPLILAFIISLIDALPILGTGGVVIPWAVISLLTGDIRTGISLFILYIVVLVVRQLIEPKVLSRQIGLHPLITLLAMYTGLRLMGFLGLVIGPVTVLILRNLFAGMLKGLSFRDALMKYRQ